MIKTPETTQPIDIDTIKKEVATDFSDLNQLILSSIDSSLPLIKAIASHSQLRRKTTQTPPGAATGQSL